MEFIEIPLCGLFKQDHRCKTAPVAVIHRLGNPLFCSVVATVDAAVVFHCLLQPPDQQQGLDEQRFSNSIALLCARSGSATWCQVHW